MEDQRARASHSQWRHRSASSPRTGVGPRPGSSSPPLDWLHSSQSQPSSLSRLFPSRGTVLLGVHSRDALPFTAHFPSEEKAVVTRVAPDVSSSRRPSERGAFQFSHTHSLQHCATRFALFFSAAPCDSVRASKLPRRALLFKRDARVKGPLRLHFTF